MELHVEQLEEIAAIDGAYQLDPDKHYVLQVKDDITLKQFERVKELVHKQFSHLKGSGSVIVVGKHMKLYQLVEGSVPE